MDSGASGLLLGGHRHRHLDPAEGSNRLGFDTKTALTRYEQQPAFGAGAFDGDGHDPFDEGVEDDLSGDGLRHFHHGCKVEVPARQRGAARGRRTVAGGLLGEALVDLRHLGVRSPAQVGVAGSERLAVRTSDELEAAG